MNTIAAQEIKRRGMVALDDALKNGAVHVIKNNKPLYVVISEERYQDLLCAEDDAYTARVRASLEDVRAGRVRDFNNVDELLRELESEEK